MGGLISTANNTNANGTTSTSTFDLIQNFDNPISSSIDIGSIVPIALNGDVSTDTARVSDMSSLSGKPLSAMSSSSLGVPPVNAPQTFTSNDLANYSAPYTPDNTFKVQILETLKQALLYILNVLRPFGVHNPSYSSQNALE